MLVGLDGCGALHLGLDYFLFVVLGVDDVLEGILLGLWLELGVCAALDVIQVVEL